MRTPEPRSRFRRDFKCEGKGIYRKLLEVGGEFWKVIDILAKDMRLPEKYHDHPLHGEMEGYRECHIRPDLLLVYRYEGSDVLILDSLGSHADFSDCERR